ncbi:PTS N-acetylglucosamine transporter subunit IIABC, putative [Babesia ovata]|uniref:PTS N-acetylglucosamine transporter subunit IIABC, putative n=1 Tax=Babesia ovata TaxID=189622 RepID=A0A2H6K8C0_9APIC|nr:PTS N-acetylglucosamine transporter subunit IIABC, putative [Babesia ovata]GBE59243.1 PTS N-acetylglucosamine transporter subunit IIABC, putative [Babesia ovata]
MHVVHCHYIGQSPKLGVRHNSCHCSASRHLCLFYADSIISPPARRSGGPHLLPFLHHELLSAEHGLPRDLSVAAPDEFHDAVLDAELLADGLAVVVQPGELSQIKARHSDGGRVLGGVEQLDQLRDDAELVVLEFVEMDGPELLGVQHGPLQRSGVDLQDVPLEVADLRGLALEGRVELLDVVVELDVAPLVVLQQRESLRDVFLDDELEASCVFEEVFQQQQADADDLLDLGGAKEVAQRMHKTLIVHGIDVLWAARELPEAVGRLVLRVWRGFPLQASSDQLDQGSLLEHGIAEALLLNQVCDGVEFGRCVGVAGKDRPQKADRLVEGESALPARK